MQKIIVIVGPTGVGKTKLSIELAKHYNGEEYINLKEIIVKQENEWVGKQIKDLDISRQELIVMIRRKNRTIIPNGLTYIKEGDAVVLYSKLKDAD